jgi:hypothetical protein
VVVAYRGRSADEIRNIYVARLVGREMEHAAPVHDDGWQIDGVPGERPGGERRGTHGGGSRGSRSRRTSARRSWRFSQDTGRTFGAPIRVDDAGSLGKVDLELLLDGSAVASWIEMADGKSAFKVRRIEPSGQRSAAIVVAGHGDQPQQRISAHGAAWERARVRVDRDRRQSAGENGGRAAPVSHHGVDSRV